MRKELPKTYAPSEFEERIYAEWMKEGLFAPSGDKSKPHFSIVIPPPNITGQLHIGHAIDNTLQDILVRYKRMKGFRTLWLPGTDHASIATEAKIVEAMRKEGLTKEDIGRDKFLERAWDWKAKYGGRIIEQLKKLGTSCDWSRERFTLDEGCSRAVREVFMRLYNKGLIYRGNRLVNWCTKCMTSISDAEVEYEDQNGNFYHILYPVKETGEKLELATTRPETMLGDTAVAINADDPRYAHLHGCHVILPLVGKEIPIICDEHADMTKGTGVVKITPAHDPNDYEVGQRHALPMVRVFTYDGRMTGPEDKAEIDELKKAGKAAVGEPDVLDCGKYAGMTTSEARKAILADLDGLGLLKGVEPLLHSVGTCYRCHHVIEPMISKQWFVKMEPLAGPAIDAVRDGRIRFVPERFEKNYLRWMESIRDWCISRQLWWGHRIPAFYCDDCGETLVTLESDPACPKCGGHMTQDPDTLDTWFSSALWPFSTMGWPDDTEDLKDFYPTSTLVTGYDIITFWVSRMIFSALEYTGKIPFDTVFIHGLVRDAQGRKMSKSLGNGIDPLEIIDQYGADALRFMLTTGITPGNDMRFKKDRLEASRNFANKLWNASRFVIMNLDDEATDDVDQSLWKPEDRWIVSRVNDAVKYVTESMEKYDLALAGQRVYDLIWNEYCDWYIEIVKERLYGDDEEDKKTARCILVRVLKDMLKLLHPFMPFITEEIWGFLPEAREDRKGKGFLIGSSWPNYSEELEYPEEVACLQMAMDMTRAIRNIRAEAEAPAGTGLRGIILCDEEREEVAKAGERYIKTLANLTEMTFVRDKSQIPEEVMSAVIDGAEIFVPLDDLMDYEAELARLRKEKDRLEGEVRRVDGKLSNKGFVDKAPQKLVDEEREKKVRYEDMLSKVELRLEQVEKKIGG